MIDISVREYVAAESLLLGSENSELRERECADLNE